MEQNHRRDEQPKHRVAKANRAAYDPRLARELWDRTLARVNS